MDVKALKGDAQLALRRLPRPFVLKVMGAIGESLPELMQVVPKIWDDLWPHVRALSFEGAAGMEDEKELVEAGKELLADFLNVDADDSHNDPDSQHVDSPDAVPEKG